MLIAQITDLHAGIKVSAEGVEIDTLRQVAKAVDHLNGFSPPLDCVVATGDLAGDGLVEEYRGLRAQLDRLRMPCYLIPGNHDDRDRLHAVFGHHGYLSTDDRFLHYTVDTHPLRLIGLDTLDPGEDRGLLCELRLQWVENQLEQGKDRPTLLFMHHPPFVCGIAEFDQMRCRNGEALGAIVGRHPQVVGVLAGHVHRAIHTSWHGCAVHVAPSVSFQYPLALDPRYKLVPIAEPGACGIYRWTPEDGLSAHISYLKPYGQAGNEDHRHQ